MGNINTYGVEIASKTAYIEWIGNNTLNQSMRNSYSFIGTFEDCVKYANNKNCTVIGEKRMFNE